MFRRPWNRIFMPPLVPCERCTKMSDSIPLHQTIVLVGRAQKDDAAALDELFRRYLPRVRSLVVLRLGNQQHALLDIDDVTQDVVADAIRGLSSFTMKSEGGFLNWLSQVVVNRIRMTLREGRAQRRGAGNVRRFADADHSIHDSHMPGAEPSPSSHVARSEAQDQIAAAMHRLPERQREILIQRIHCHMGYDEIAESMGFPNADVARTNYSRSLQRLRELTRPQGGGD